MALLPRIPWDLAALWLLLAVPIPVSMGLECRDNQYFYNQKCCSDCAPGQRMRSRCTAWTDTVCSPCQDGYFSSQHHHGFCKSCTVCQTRKGSVEVKPCEKTSDRVCVCQAGFQPAETSTGNAHECSQCPEGTFSRGRNENCQPWTNCSSFGKSTLRAGSASEDSVCSSPAALDPLPTGFLENRDPLPTGFLENRDPLPTGFLENRDPLPTEFLENRDPFPTEFLENRDPLPTEFPGNGSRGSREIPEVCAEPGGAAEPGWGSLSLLLLCLLLLLVSGISILLLILQAARKKSRNGPRRSIRHPERSCRVPIQEEQLDPNSGLIKP